MKMVFISDSFGSMAFGSGPRTIRGRWRLLAAGALVLAATSSACSPSREPGASVVSAVYPLSFIAEAIAGGAVGVTSLTPGGAEPHDLELTPSQARSIAEAELVLYVGSGFQPAVEDAVRQSGNGLDVLELVEPLEAGDRAEEDVEDEGEEHGHEGADPHVWLDPTEAASIADAVLAEMAAIAPSEEDALTARHHALVDRLSELDAAFASSLESCAEDTIVVSHEAFGYLTRRYGLEQVGISGINPEQEPSPQRLAEVARFVKENNIETIYLERLVPAEIGETLADETGAATAYLDPLEMAPEEGDYLSAMEENLEALRNGLGCSEA